ncbi:uncharacterized protein BDZ99DRAFT_468650 [Mytilinidion resinicola]|uniref:Uncharacterized protein n=1 Tax=Mytilinidion resinicola TaxID=574789 RepID=A0A6A6Y2G1_9PEZI|nr:uncharacterized protein BDZ99DRAFT_468650 [Mytilinidion resinicola]KAF2803006.1 hypothetical protein BDZ99DRAFT_468650 [Mytilinidion resinicola]
MADRNINPANNFEPQQKRSKDLAINNTYIRRSLVRLGLHATAKFFHRYGPCAPISKLQNRQNRIFSGRR